MRNVAKRMLLADAVQGILEWKTKVALDFNCQRGQIILKRVGGRWRNEELWGAYRNWKMKWREDADRERGEMIMRRVGARMMNKELAMTWDAWHRNYREGIADMVRFGRGSSYMARVGWLFDGCWRFGFCCSALVDQVRLVC